MKLGLYTFLLEHYWNKPKPFDAMVQVCDAAGREAEAAGWLPGLDPQHYFPVQRSERVGSPGHHGAGWSSAVSGKHLHFYLFIYLFSVHTASIHFRCVWSDSTCLMSDVRLFVDVPQTLWSGLGYSRTSWRLRVLSSMRFRLATALIFKRNVWKKENVNERVSALMTMQKRSGTKDYSVQCARMFYHPTLINLFIFSKQFIALFFSFPKFA